MIGRAVILVLASVTGFVMAIAALAFVAGMACRTAIVERR